MYTVIEFSLMESETLLDNGVTLQSIFARRKDNISRTEVYKIGDGSVVAFQDNVNGEWGPLCMELQFMTFHSEEPEYNTICKNAGMFNPESIRTFDLGR